MAPGSLHMPLAEMHLAVDTALLQRKQFGGNTDWQQLLQDARMQLRLAAMDAAMAAGSVADNAAAAGLALGMPQGMRSEGFASWPVHTDMCLHTHPAARSAEALPGWSAAQAGSLEGTDSSWPAIR